MAATLSTPPRVAGLYALSREAFTELLGEVFEHSPWVASQAWFKRPFADLDALHTAMVTAMRQAPPEAQLALLQAHPQLAGREAQSGTLTAASADEQRGAGLQALQPAQFQRMQALNAAYVARHGFPFIVCARHYTAEGILHELQRRGALDTPRERLEAMEQIVAITRLRLRAMFPADAG